VLIQAKLPKPEDSFYAMFDKLNQANKTCAIALSSLSDQEACTLLNEMLFVRLKSEQYYRRLGLTLSPSERHNLRKPIAEVQMKT